MPRSRLPLIIALAVVALILGGFVIFLQFLAGDDVAALTLPPTASSPASSDASSDDPSATADPGSGTGGTTTASELAGTWTIADGSVVGYRVREQLGGVSALTDSVGRTSAITGSTTIEASGDGLTVTAASFEADLTQLASDDGRRDNRIRSIGLQSNEFPTATFGLTDAIAVSADGLTGSTFDVILTGDLTIHGVTKRVSIAGQAQLNGDRIEIVGSLTFPFSDFGMTPPSIGTFVQVEDDATLEVLLSLAKA
jgi:polyisoprenoid-binding protein YceI